MAEKLTIKQRWDDMPKNNKIGLVVGLLFCLAFGTFMHFQNAKIREGQAASAEAQARAKASSAGAAGMPNVSLPSQTSISSATIPTTQRNQGLESMQIQIEQFGSLLKKMQDDKGASENEIKKLKEQISLLEKQKMMGGGGAVPSVDLNSTTPPPVDFNADPTKPDFSKPTKPAAPAKSSEIKVSESADNKPKKAAEAPAITIPRNAIIESVMLSGINAMVNVSQGGTGGATSARQIGTPFITRVKGNALLPNGWKVAELGECFISGTGVGVLSTEKANVIADSVSCVDTKGQVYEGKIKAFGVDEDGVSGIAGKLVTKQGTVLMKTALAGIAAGLGQALTPQPITTVNTTTGGSGNQGYRTPNGDLIAGTALGTGISNSMSQLSKFYLDYARQMMPVVEINAGTRITWILQEAIDLKATVNANTNNGGR